MEICIDFDGTCVAHEFPKIGKDIGAVPVLKRIVEDGHKIILFTMRDNASTDSGASPEFPEVKEGNFLADAVNWFLKNDIPLYGINTNPEQKTWTQSPKAYGKMYIDDAALGCPLKVDPEKSARPFVDWEKVERMLEDIGVLPSRFIREDESAYSKTAAGIANKYVFGDHDALTDRQEVKDMTEDIMTFASEYHSRKPIEISEPFKASPVNPDSENYDYLRGFADGYGGPEPHEVFPVGFNNINEIWNRMYELKKR